ncbi:sugar phosphate isomerase/epimerase family protein [Halomonas huangheensis]|uniref:Xylose isomerase-like TIM barrel domain-containing protein n=1 Tax=Halomonas huangheensis TaxID=1178482 RepID=W1N5S4_9GAMM|nr:sugar phosphate isomerase/epimerase family protein [Halomonas huangheensis]ALM54308.1 AP endonuclease [Halomonas huangheensis]ERL50863.1 hypothetical protein BJB45_19900 [Halomonas huangheensis]
MALGIRGHDLSATSPHQLASEIAQRGLGCLQLALPRSFNIGTSVGELTPGLAHKVGKAFQANDVQIAVLGCYINIIHPDIDIRSAELERFKEYIRFCRDFGCGVVGTETGNVNEEIAYTTDNFNEQAFQAVVESVKLLVAEAEKYGVIVGIEPGVNHPIYSPQTMHRLLEEVGSSNLQVIFDPTNLITIDNHEDQQQIFQQALDLWGENIIVLHAKDYAINDGKVAQVPLGTGLMEYTTIMRYLNDHKPGINIIMDEIDHKDIPEAKAFMQQFMTANFLDAD